MTPNYLFTPRQKAGEAVGDYARRIADWVNERRGVEYSDDAVYPLRRGRGGHRMTTITVRPCSLRDVALMQGHAPRPAGAQLIGVVTHADGAEGLLIRTADGLLAQINAGVIRSLDQSAAEAALKGAACY